MMQRGARRRPLARALVRGAIALLAVAPRASRADEPITAHRPLAPLAVDLLGTVGFDVPFATLGAGVAADVALARLGPGVLAAGGGASYEACASLCAYYSATTPLELSRTQLSTQARASYRLALSGARAVEVYPIVTAGPVVTRTIVALDGGAAEHRGRSVGLSLGAGAGGSLMVAGPLFVGGEVRLRFGGLSPGYDLPADADARLDQATVSQWSVASFLTGLVDAVFAVGVRIP